jgi:hypothetical protein
MISSVCGPLKPYLLWDAQLLQGWVEVQFQREAIGKSDGVLSEAALKLNDATLQVVQAAGFASSWRCASSR